MNLIRATAVFFVAVGALSNRALAAGATPPVRIVSLAPNLTELVFAFGLQDALVGVTEQCDFPTSAKEKPRIGGFTGPNLELILKAKPTVVLATEGNPRPLLDALRAKSIVVTEFHAKNAGELPAQVQKLGETLNAEGKSRDLALAQEKALARLDALRNERGSVLLALQFNPIYAPTADTWLGNLFARARFRNIVPSGPQPYPVVSPELPLANRPDFVVVFADTDKSVLNLPVVIAAREFIEGKFKPKLRPQLVRAPESILTRPGPRLVEAVEFLLDTDTWKSR